MGDRSCGLGREPGLVEVVRVIDLGVRRRHRDIVTEEEVEAYLDTFKDERFLAPQTRTLQTPGGQLQANT